MNSLIVRTFLVAALLIACGASADAQTVLVSFKGTITALDHTPPQLADVAIGTPFRGFYSYNLSTPNSADLPGFGDYNQTTRPYGFTIIIGTHTFTARMPNNSYTLQIANDFGGQDSFVVVSSNIDTELLVAGMFLEWIDPTRTALSDVTLPATPPDLTKWPEGRGMTIVGFGPFSVSGHVDQVQLGAGLFYLSEPTGPQGPTGAQGPTGPAGPAGLTGLAGPEGAQGLIGLQGSQGAQGLQGFYGPTGAPGPQGESLVAGSTVMVAKGTPAPAGYTLVGSYVLVPAPRSAANGVLSVDVYRKN
jgi:Collagen triple helix repeat (20 copies)